MTDILVEKIREKKKKKQKAVRCGLSYVISFLMSVILAFTALLLGCYFGFVNEENIRSSLEKKELYNKVESYFYQNAEYVIMTSGLPAEVLEDSVKLRQIYGDMNGYIEAGLNSREYTIETAKIGKSFEDKAMKYLKNEGIPISEDQKSSLKQYGQKLEALYKNTVQLPGIPLYGSIRGIFEKVIFASLLFTVVFFAAAAVLLCKLYKRKREGLKYVHYSLFGSMLMTAAIPVVLLVTQSYRRLNIQPEYIYEFVFSYIEKGLITIVLFGAGLGMLGVFGVLFNRYLNKK